MSLTNYWYPTDLASLFEHFDSISQSKSRNNSNYHHTLNVPKMDLVEQDQAHTLVVELPGYKKDAINIALENNRLTISGEADKTSEYEQVSVIIIILRCWIG